MTHARGVRYGSSIALTLLVVAATLVAANRSSASTGTIGSYTTPGTAQFVPNRWVTEIHLDIGGGSGIGFTGDGVPIPRYGARVQADLAVVPGHNYNVAVGVGGGEAGTSIGGAPGGAGGGASAFQDCSGFCFGSGEGDPTSAKPPTNGLAMPLAVAAGAGGDGGGNAGGGGAGSEPGGNYATALGSCTAPAGGGPGAVVLAALAPLLAAPAGGPPACTAGGAGGVSGLLGLGAGGVIGVLPGSSGGFSHGGNGGTSLLAGGGGGGGAGLYGGGAGAGGAAPVVAPGGGGGAAGLSALIGEFSNGSVGTAFPATSPYVMISYSPGPARTVTALAGAGQATVTWLAPTDTGGVAHVISYTVTSSSTTDPTPHTVTVNCAAPSHPCASSPISATVTGLSAGKSYLFTVVATSNCGIADPTACVGPGSSTTIGVIPT